MNPEEKEAYVVLDWGDITSLHPFNETGISKNYSDVKCGEKVLAVWKTQANRKGRLCQAKVIATGGE